MLLLKFHKWLLGLALIASIISFSGVYTSLDVTRNNHTELLVNTKPVSKANTYIFGSIKSNNYYNFSFKALLKRYNSKNNIQLKIANNSALQYVDYLHFKTVYYTFNKSDYIVFS